MPELLSLPATAVDVVYNGTLENRNWWIVHIEPTGAVSVWKRPEGNPAYQRLLNSSLGLTWRGIAGTVESFVDTIVASLDIEGLYRASTPGPTGGLESVSEITYKVTPFSE